MWSEGSFCGNCGQKLVLSYSIGDFVLEALPALVRGDRHFFRTYRLLWCNPGALTKRYYAGQRTRYLSPITMLLTAVFLLFMLPLFGGLSSEDALDLQSGNVNQLQTIERFDATMSAKISDIRQATGENRRALIEDFSFQLALRNVDARLLGLPIISTDDFADFWEEQHKPDETWLSRRLQEARLSWATDPEGKILGLRGSLLKFSWLLIPISLPIMLLVLPGRSRVRFKHTVFAGYSLSFMLSLLVFVAVLDLLGVTSGTVFLGIIAVGLVHLFFQIRGSYDLSYLKAVCYFLVVLLILTISFVGYLLLLFLLRII
ncbi:DUF3667 domain-containing protein [Cochlodiniinecator piscidefendens]|uniref:DUF3667 domain-containing protein n=1 Tax=Cochlodiniinecator piscidefendens TaxID=2715756 RepID=UPI0014086DFA|nr:DUF3667 domain-containing protein [Cochlodiniinecator piscidefendens]